MTVQDAVQEALESKRISKIRNALFLLLSDLKKRRSPEFRLGLAATFTLEPQLDFLRFSMARSGFIPEIAMGGLDNVEQSLFHSGSKLLAAECDALVVLWRLEDLYPQFVYEADGWSAQKREEAVISMLERIRNICKTYRSAGKAPLFLSTFPYPNISPGPVYDLHRPNGLQSAVLQFNLEMMKEAAAGGIQIFDFAGWARNCDAKSFDMRMDFAARQPIAADAVLSFSDALARTLFPIRRPSAKVLAVDLDNVLWGGILAESDPAKLQIGRDYPGNVYFRIQQVVKSLKSRGILLALVSKNDLSEAREAFKRIPEMALSLDDFSAVRVNWKPKYENLREIADELNLGLESFVFVDDQGFEREEMTHFLPDVRILPVTEDPLTILEALNNNDYFDSYRLQESDLNRSADYENQKKRNEAAKTSAGAEEFLRSLHLRADVNPLDERTLPRAAQMLGKTNQFNLTGRRHSEARVREWMKNKKNILLALSLKDRFGDQGIIGLLIALENGDALRVDSFLLSCRAIGRGAERVLWSELLRRASDSGCRELTAEFIPTAKNGQVSALYDSLGMKRMEESRHERRYRLSLPASHSIPEWFVEEELVSR